MNEATIIILGITGDLAKRKLIPAVYALVLQKKIQNYVIVGAGFEESTPSAIIAASKPWIEHVDEAVLAAFEQRIVYQRMDFNAEHDFSSLYKTVVQEEQRYRLPGNRLVYLACSPTFFCTITTAITATGIVIKQEKESQQPWHRVIYEKPFGSDRASAHAINECISHNLLEQQVFRIDHYLAKELVGNIALVRFTNRIFEPLWNRQHIDHVQIILTEQVGVENRGAYYDHYGALKDVVQNHMLQLLALIAMEAPQKLSGEFIRDEKTNVLRCAYPVDGIRGQYDGYKDEPGVALNSTTETFAALQIRVDNERWQGVPFYLKTGKALEKKETVIYIKFKMVDCLLTRSCPSESNYLTIRLYPDATFSIELNTKKPGILDQVMPVNMAFSHDLYRPASTEAYEILLLEVMKGDQSISVRFDEIEYAWNIVDQITAMQLPLYSYERGSEGPKQAQTYATQHAFRWYS